MNTTKGPVRRPANSKKHKLHSSSTVEEQGEDVFEGEAGVLTIIDLTDPVIDPDSACVLFDICLALFVERTTCQKVVALDEAHNYMRANSEASAVFTSTILKNVREQRHKGVRVIVATQEPTINPQLLDLCSVTIVHRFTSPDWYKMIQRHLAGVEFAEDFLAQEEGGADLLGDEPNAGVSFGLAAKRRDGARKQADKFALLREIVRLKVGESLLFCPTAALRVQGGKVKPLFEGYIRFRTRPRLTNDGGRSKLAVGRDAK